MSERTFKVDSPLMQGQDVLGWQRWLTSSSGFGRWGIEYPLKPDGYYGVATRAATATFMRAWGVVDTGEALENGLTDDWRIKLRNNNRNTEESTRAVSDEIKDYRARLRARTDNADVCYPCVGLITDANGWSAWHDGVDLITAWRGPALAIVTGKIVRVSSGSWWGSNPQPSPGHPIADGDGIIILESTVDVGPFRDGMHFGYGHTEEATVKVGDHVQAGEQIGRIGWARAPHIHFLINDDPPVNGFYRGVGTMNPARFLQYANDNS